jgi:DnaK suppressor protein
MCVAQSAANFYSAVSPTEESIVAKAAKKPVSKPVSSSAKKTAAKAAPPAKPVKAAKVTTKAVVSKAKAPIASAKAAPAKAVAVKATTSVKSKAKPVAAKTAPTPVQPKAAAPKKASVKAVASKPAPAAPPQPVPKQPTQRPMKTAEIKTTSAKPAPVKPAAKAGKKITGMPHNDAELLAMPESDYMNKAQLAYFKAKLTTMRDEILENARETGEHLKENEVFADPNDRATVEEENLLEQRVRDRERKLLKKINASIARIEEGEYGFCLETGDPIGLPRLLARPTAELSIEAQEKHERLEKLYAD